MKQYVVLLTTGIGHLGLMSSSTAYHQYLWFKFDIFSYGSDANLEGLHSSLFSSKYFKFNLSVPIKCHCPAGPKYV